ncbi:endopolygalacturonase [Luteolibacter sp. LG18]|nr:endopolygalacturonase [Luteolibacter sp. LG18]
MMMHANRMKWMAGMAAVVVLGGTPGLRAEGIKVPDAAVIGTKVVDVTRHGAVADGLTNCAAAIQKAIDETAAAGGGRVVVPKGRFLSGPLVLKSGIELHLAEGAVLLMGSDPALFPVTDNNRAPFLYAENGHDIRLSGKGVVDGQGAPWWKAFRAEKEGGVKGPRRPQLIAIKNCERVEVQGITTLNPPNTHYSFRQCRELSIRGIKAVAPDESPNTDALNLSSVRNVLIEGSEISTGDDNIVLLCGAARQKGVPEVENVAIRDCKLGCGHGLSIGSYTSGGVRNVTVERVAFEGTTSGIRLKADRDRGGVVEGIRYKDITMTKVRHPIFITSYYPKPPPTPETAAPAGAKGLLPVWRNISLENIQVTDAANAITLWGLPEQKIENVSLRHVAISAKAGALVIQAKGVEFSDVKITSQGPPLRTFDAEVQGLPAVPLTSEPVKFQ